ncbi:glycoprotease family-domain-containing protein [Neurospora tetraspora]|uniref:Glycoprotease family-domain-containing protein n=1 Tax=Neurospora tetraspora TaxID=94610 RepID=A0AAE0J0R8_9PEZI|nr:glycoprotease family-domain-containing protein [Neurospora tetraspora]
MHIYNLRKAQDRPAPPRHKQEQEKLLGHVTQFKRQKELLTLAIETSCDDTCVALLQSYESTERTEKPEMVARLLFNKKITSDQRQFGGVHPAIAVEWHQRHLATLVEEAIRSLPEDGTRGNASYATSRLKYRSPDLIAVTRGPGMPTSLATGMEVAKGLALAWGIPIVGVHHMQAHALTPQLVYALDRSFAAPSLASSPWGQRQQRVVDPELKAASEKQEEEVDQRTANLDYPYLNLLVSGGHTQLVYSASLTSHLIQCTTDNIALGDMLDKAARKILPPSVLNSGQNVMYAAALERFAFPRFATGADEREYNFKYTPPATRAAEIEQHNSPYGWHLSPPLYASRKMEYNFTGLGSQAQRIADSLDGFSSYENCQDQVLSREDSPAESGSGVGSDDMAPSPADSSTSTALLSPALNEQDQMEQRRYLARATMQLAFEHLASRIVMVLQQQAKTSGEAQKVKTLVVSGGVASNQFLRHVLRRVLEVRGFGHIRIMAPPVHLCTDNAAMIAWTGSEMWRAGWVSKLDMLPIKKWSMSSTGEQGGILGTEEKPFYVRRSS